MIPDYGKIHSVGHRDLKQLFDGPVVVQEKIDGSQFSAMVDDEGELHCRSKGGPLDPAKDGTKGLFAPSIQHLLTVKHEMVVGFFYRFEAMQRPKHNVLAYERVPRGNLVLYDCCNVDGTRRIGLGSAAHALGVELVQEIYQGPASEISLQDWLKAKPQLGGAMVEGVVVKNYAHNLKGKFVAPRFQEIMHGRPVRAHTPKAPVVDIGRKYCSEARWEKAIAHLREAGTIGDAREMRDLGHVIKEVQRDVLDECGAEIREELFEAFAKDLRNAWITGLPDWYKRRCSAGEAGE